MFRIALTVGALALALIGCQEPPPNNGTTAPTTTDPTTTPTTSTTTETTFPTDTTFGGPQDLEPTDWLHITEMGAWNLPGGDFTSMTGTFSLQEIVNELDTMYGPDCLATWTLSGSPPLLSPATCPGCDEATIVTFTPATGDPNLCQSPDLPPIAGQPGWRMAWHPGDQTIYRDINATGVWVAWWNGIRTGDTIDFTFADSYAIFIEDMDDT